MGVKLLVARVLVAELVLCKFTGKTPGPFDRSEVNVLLAADDEVRSNTLDVMKAFEVVVPSVEDVE